VQVTFVPFSHCYNLSNFPFPVHVKWLTNVHMLQWSQVASFFLIIH